MNKIMFVVAMLVGFPMAHAKKPAKPVKHSKEAKAPAIKGLAIKILKKGKGPAIKKGQIAQVHYTGWLVSNGKKFDSSKDHGQPFEFPVGGGQVIQGWDLGVEGMQVGESRQLIINPELAYGDQGAPGAIPPKAKLKFIVDLLKIK